MLKKLLFLLLIIISSNIFSQTYIGSGLEIFFGRMPSAKIEAMGRIQAVDYDPYFVSYSNPASLDSAKGTSVFYSHSSPFYLGRNDNYYFGGISHNFESVGSFALNMLLLDCGSYITTDDMGDITGKDRATRKLITLTYSNSFKEWFNYGVNANLYIDDFWNEESFTSTFFELGLTKDFILKVNDAVKDKLLLGTQIKNILNQSIEYPGEKEYFPSVFRFGVSNTLEYYDKSIIAKSHLFGFTLGCEYQDLFNSKIRTAYKVGSEISVLDILYFRLGYYYETQRDCENCKSYLEDTTYGFGLNLDFNKLLIKQIPLMVKLDYANLEQPTYVTDRSDWDNFKTFNIIVNYGLNY